MIQKRKAEYLLKKSFDKTKTLESFCKYEENRFNQAQFNSNFVEKSRPSPAHTLTNAQTDKKVQEIKAKYGLYPRGVSNHQRSVSVVMNGKGSEQIPRQPLGDHAKNYNTLNPISQSQNKPSRIPHQPNSNNISMGNKQNLTDFKIKSSIRDNQCNKLQDANCNVTFNQSVFQKISIEQNPVLRKKDSAYDDLRRKAQYSSSNPSYLQTNQTSMIALNPRIQNINRLNSKIKSTLQHITQISSFSKDNPPLMTSMIVQNTKPNSDMVQTRVVKDKYFRREKNYSTVKEYKLREEGLCMHDREKEDNRLRPVSVSKNYCATTHEERKYSSVLKPSLQQAKLLTNYKTTTQNNKNHTQEKHSRALLNDFSFETERLPQPSQKQQTMLKNPPTLEHDHNTIRIKQDKSQYFDLPIKQNYTFIKKQPAQQNERLSSMIKLALSNISARKQTKQAQNNSSEVERNSQGQFKMIQDVIKKQIELDQNLRKAKVWLKYHNDDCKETKIKHVLYQRLSSQTNGCNQIQFFNSSQGYRILKSLQITDEQIDPFYTVRSQEFNINQVVDCYLQAEEHWRNALIKKKLVESMISSKWIQHVDLEKKKFVTVTDLTRFVNFASRGAYKNNRDLVLVFRRLALFDDINYPSTDNKLSKSSTSWLKQTKGNKLTQQSLRKLLA